VKIWYEDNNNPTIFFDFDSTGNHQLVLKSTQNAFNTYTNWANANGTNIVDPTTTNIKKIEIRDTGQPTTVQCPTMCSVTINVK
jgi:hypothetical protein